MWTRESGSDWAKQRGTRMNERLSPPSVRLNCDRRLHQRNVENAPREGESWESGQPRATMGLSSIPHGPGFSPFPLSAENSGLEKKG